MTKSIFATDNYLADEWWCVSFLLIAHSMNYFYSAIGYISECIQWFKWIITDLLFLALFIHLMHTQMNYSSSFLCCWQLKFLSDHHHYQYSFTKHKVGKEHRIRLQYNRQEKIQFTNKRLPNWFILMSTIVWNALVSRNNYFLI